jgi:hypothetical protein
MLDAFLESAVERHHIYVERMNGEPKPWTDDPILRDFFFCNLFRQYDKCSKWIIDNIVPFKRWDLIILYRFISTYSTFERIKSETELDNLEGVADVLESMDNLDMTIFSSCFIRNPRIQGGWAKTYMVPFCTIKEIQVYENQLKEVFKRESLEEMCQFLRQFSGIGGFMSYEYACDFAYFPDWKPKDTMKWANMGPGALRGMSLLLHGIPGRKMPFDEWLRLAQELLPILQRRINEKFPNEVVTMREVEHWLCEFQKYCKYWGMVKNGDKVKHRSYNGRM